MGAFSYFPPGIPKDKKTQGTSGVDLTQISQNIVPEEHNCHCIGLEGTGNYSNQWKCVYSVGVQTTNLNATTVCSTTLCMGAENVAEADIAKINGITNGTVAANTALVVDASRDITTIRNVTSDGTVSANEVSGVLIAVSKTTTERNALTPSAGMIVFNTTDTKFQGYDGSAWQDLH